MLRLLTLLLDRAIRPLPSPEDHSTPNPFRGAFWTLAMRWSDRLIGLASTLILARLLLPDDFGVFALASIVVGLADVLLDLGVHIALLRDPHPQREDYDTAWTLRILQSILAAALLITLASPLAASLGEPRLISLLPWLAGALLVGSAENIGIVDFQKQQRFDRDFRFFFTKRVIGFIITTGIALALGSYWALVVGTWGQRLFGVALSYALHPYRPHLSLRHSKKIWAFSRWILLQNIGIYLEQRMDKLLVGKCESAAWVGTYSVADEIASIPGTELLAPLNRALLPALVAQLHEPARVRETYLLALSVQCLIGFPASVGLMLVADQAVAILLGPHWLEAIVLLKWLSIGGLVAAMTASGRYLLLAAGHAKSLAVTSWLQVVLFALTATVAFPIMNAERIAILRVVVAFITGSVVLAFLLRRFPIVNGSDIVRAIIRPLVATAIMTMAVISLQSSAWVIGSGALIAEVVLGVTVYVLMIIGLWRVVGRPNGAEYFLFQHWVPWLLN
ncbi:oligosaccharide flippase family protein [Candidatus Contendibacter odensensis]|nr:oligosaccharide flippase family protein [Candidatus Contendobacter odensis]